MGTSALLQAADFTRPKPVNVMWAKISKSMLKIGVDVAS